MVKFYKVVHKLFNDNDIEYEKNQLIRYWSEEIFSDKNDAYARLEELKDAHRDINSVYRKELIFTDKTLEIIEVENA
jgi:hypothetical protein